MTHRTYSRFACTTLAVIGVLVLLLLASRGISVRRPHTIDEAPAAAARSISTLGNSSSQAPLLLEQMVHAFSIQQVDAVQPDFLLSSGIRQNIFSGEHITPKVVHQLAYFDASINSHRFAEKSALLAFYRHRTRAYAKRSPEELGLLFARASDLGLHLKVVDIALSESKLSDTIRLHPSQLTKAIGIGPALPTPPTFDDLERALSDLRSGSARPTTRHSFNPRETSFRSFTSSFRSLSSSNQFDLLADSPGIKFRTGFFATDIVTLTIDRARTRLRAIDEQLLVPNLPDVDRERLEAEAAGISAKIGTLAEQATLVIDARTPQLDGERRGAGVQTRSEPEQNDLASFRRTYKENAAAFYSTLEQLAILGGLDAAEAKGFTRNFELLASFAVAATTQNYFAFAATGLQIAGQIFGGGSGNANSTMGAIVGQLVAIRREIAALRQEMREHFLQIERRLDALDDKLSSQYAFLISSFDLVENLVEHLTDLQLSELEEDYRLRLNELSADIDRFNADLWRTRITTGGAIPDLRGRMRSAARAFLYTHLSTRSGFTGLSHPRFLGPANCYDQLVRGLGTEADTEGAVEGAARTLFEFARAGDFAGRARCVDLTFRGLTSLATPIRVGRDDDGTSRVDWLPGYFRDGDYYVLDGVTFAFSPTVANTINSSIRAVTGKMQDQDLLREISEARLVELTDAVRNANLLGSEAGLELQSLLYLWVVDAFNLKSNILFRSPVVRAITEHGRYIESTFLPEYGSPSGAYKFYRVPADREAWMYDSGKLDHRYVKEQRELFRRHRMRVRDAFDSSLAALARNLDEIVTQTFGGWGGFWEDVTSLSDGTRVTYTEVPVDHLLVIDEGAVHSPTRNPAYDGPHKDAFTVLEGMFTAEVRAALQVFNRMGKEISAYPEPAFGLPGRPAWNPRNPLPEAEIRKFEQRYTEVLSEFRIATRLVAEGTGAAVSQLMKQQTGSDLPSFANSLLDLYLFGRALEMNLNEVPAMYRALGLADELKEADVTALDYFSDHASMASHVARVLCGSPPGRLCNSPAEPAKEKYPLPSYMYPYLVGSDPEAAEAIELPLFYRQIAPPHYSYQISKGFLGGRRATKGMVRKEQPAIAVGSLTTETPLPAFPYLDGDYMHTNDRVGIDNHPGIVSASLGLDTLSEIGAWQRAIPDCENQARRIVELDRASKALLNPGGSDVAVGSADELCAYTHRVTRLLAIGRRNAMYIASLNSGAVDFLAGIRGDYNSLVIDEMTRGLQSKEGATYATKRAFRRLVRQQLVNSG